MRPPFNRYVPHKLPSFARFCDAEMVDRPYIFVNGETIMGLDEIKIIDAVDDPRRCRASSTARRTCGKT